MFVTVTMLLHANAISKILLENPLESFIICWFMQKGYSDFFNCLQCTNYRAMQWCCVTMAGFLCSLMQTLYCLTLHGVVMHCNLYLIHMWDLAWLYPVWVFILGYKLWIFCLLLPLGLDYCNQKRKVTLSRQCLISQVERHQNETPMR